MGAWSFPSNHYRDKSDSCLQFGTQEKMLLLSPFPGIILRRGQFMLIPTVVAQLKGSVEPHNLSHLVFVICHNIFSYF